MIDDATELPDGQTLQADVCVVGGGAAGIALAVELADSKLSVLLLESGGLKSEKDTQQLYAGTVVDERLHCPPDRYRQRRFGGSTTIWGGRCAPLDDIDFETRDYIPHSGWPISREELLRFYPRANELCELGEFQFHADAAFDGPLRPMIEGWRSTHFTTDTLERFSCPTNFASRYRQRLKQATNVRVLLHANVTQIQLSANAECVESLAVRTLTGKRFTVNANRVVLAAGGLEVARLLLANRDTFPDGIGNENDVVGRYYMCHIAGTLGAFKPDGDRVWHGYDVSHEGIYCRRRLALRPEVQRQLRIGNFIARLHHPAISDPAHGTAILSALQLAKGLISYEYGMRLHGGQKTALRTWLHHLANVARAPWEVAGFGYHMTRYHFLAARRFPSIVVQSTAGIYSLDVHAEQEPNAASRVQLAEDRDALGMRRLSVDWRYTVGDIRTVHEAVRLFAEDVRADGVGTFEYDPDSIELEMSRYGAYGGHHLGTARMGSDPCTSVVDLNCRVHGLRNLFVAGGAVFPTSSQANPTLTIVALAVRLAAHLRSSAPQDYSSRPEIFSPTVVAV